MLGHVASFAVLAVSISAMKLAGNRSRLRLDPARVETDNWSFQSLETILCRADVLAAVISCVCLLHAISIVQQGELARMAGAGAEWPHSGDGVASQMVGGERHRRRVPLPGVGRSSPIIWGEQMFLSVGTGAGQGTPRFCVDRRTGKILWQQTAWKGTPEPSHVMNGLGVGELGDGWPNRGRIFRPGRHPCGLPSLKAKSLWSVNFGKFAGPWGTAACPS